MRKRVGVLIITTLICGFVCAQTDNDNPAFESASRGLLIDLSSPFVEKYDTLEDKNIQSFFDDWLSWSEQYSKRHNNSLCDSLFNIFRGYYAKVEKEKKPYLVLPATVEMYSCQDEFYYISDKDEFPDCKEDVRFFIPHVSSDKLVLYLTPAIYERLSVLIKSGQRKLVEKYIDVGFRELDDCYTTMPTVETIKRYDNGTFAVVNTYCSEWEYLFLPADTHKIKVLAGFIE